MCQQLQGAGNMAGHSRYIFNPAGLILLLLLRRRHGRRRRRDYYRYGRMVDHQT